MATTCLEGTKMLLTLVSKIDVFYLVLGVFKLNCTSSLSVPVQLASLYSLRIYSLFCDSCFSYIMLLKIFILCKKGNFKHKRKRRACSWSKVVNFPLPTYSRRYFSCVTGQCQSIHRSIIVFAMQTSADFSLFCCADTTNESQICMHHFGLIFI